MSVRRVYTILACLGLLVGVGLGGVWPVSSTWSAGYLWISILAITCCWYKYRFWVMPMGWCLIFIVLGSWRFNGAQMVPAMDVSHYAGQTLVIEGMIVDDPEVASGTTKFVLQVKSVDDQPSASGKVLVTLRKYPTYQYGNVVKITGKLSLPSEDSQTSYARYLSRYGIYAICSYPEVQIIKEFAGNWVWRRLYQVKHYFLQVTNQILPEPTAGLLSGLLLGISAVLPKNLLDGFNATGLTHIVALSGFNITIVAGAVVSLLRWLPLSIRLSVAVVVIWLFVLLTGGAPSAIRAALMGTLILLAGLVGRLADISISVCLTAAVMVLVNPKILGSDIGFQLSFLATLGIIYLNPVLQQVLYRWPALLRQFILPTISALVMVTPILAADFGRISLVAPLTNVLVVPLVPLAMLLGFWAVVGGIIQTDLGLVLGWIAWAPLRLIVVLTEYFRSFPWASINVKIAPGVWMVFYYLGIVILLVIYYVRQAKTKERPLSAAHPS